MIPTLGALPGPLTPPLAPARRRQSPPKRRGTSAAAVARVNSEHRATTQWPRPEQICEHAQGAAAGFERFKSASHSEPESRQNVAPTSSVDSQTREALKRRVLARRLDAARQRTPLHRMPPNVAVCVRREPCKRIRAQAAGDADAAHKRRTLAEPRQQSRHGQAHVRHAVIGEPHQLVRDGGARVGWERRVGRAQQASREVDEDASATGTSSRRQCVAAAASVAWRGMAWREWEREWER